MITLKGIKIKHYITSFIMMMFVFFAIGYLYLLNSNAYKFAKEFLKENPKVIQEIGEVNSIRPSLLNSHVHYGAGIGTAKIQVILSGGKKSAKADLDLITSENSWLVKEGILQLEDGSKVPLNP